MQAAHGWPIVLQTRAISNTLSIPAMLFLNWNKKRGTHNFFDMFFRVRLFVFGQAKLWGEEVTFSGRKSECKKEQENEIMRQMQTSPACFPIDQMCSCT